MYLRLTRTEAALLTTIPGVLASRHDFEFFVTVASSQKSRLANGIRWCRRRASREPNLKMDALDISACEISQQKKNLHEKPDPIDSDLQADRGGR
jgi:hypothetical protein